MARQQPTRYISHDRLFKEFFRRFLERFMRLFYPEKAARLEWNGLKFIEKEQIINQPGRAMRITDVAVSVPIKENGKPVFRTSVDDNIVKRKKKNDENSENDAEKAEEIIIVHIDAEANKPKPVPGRMHEYYSLYRIIEDKPVLPIALLIRGRSTKIGIKQEVDDDNHKMQTYTERLWGREMLRFYYYEIVLQDMLSEKYLNMNDPVAAALAVLMKHPDEISAFIKKRSLDIITQSDDITTGDKFFLEGFVQEYVTDEEVQGGTKEIMKQLAEYQMTYRERIELEFQQNMLIKMLGMKFKEITDEIAEQIKATRDTNLLDDITSQLLVIETLDDLKLSGSA